MKDIVIVGASGFAHEVVCLINKINEYRPTWNILGFIDSVLEKGSHTEYGDIVGNDEDLNEWRTDINVVIALGSPKALKRISSLYNNPNIKFPNLISPDASLLDEKRLRMGMGNIICSNCVISTNVEIGNYNVFNWNTTIGHDTIIGNYNSMMPGVRVSGAVNIGDMNFFGVSSVVLQQKKIGNSIVLGAGSVLMSNAKDECTYMGNPAKRIIL